MRERSIRRQHQPIDQRKDGLGKIDVEQRFRSGEFKDLAILKEPVESALAQFEESRLQRIGELGCGILPFAARRRFRS